MELRINDGSLSDQPELSTATRDDVSKNSANVIFAGFLRIIATQKDWFTSIPSIFDEFANMSSWEKNEFSYKKLFSLKKQKS